MFEGGCAPACARASTGSLGFLGLVAPAGSSSGHGLHQDLLQNPWRESVLRPSQKFITGLFQTIERGSRNLGLSNS